MIIQYLPIIVIMLIYLLGFIVEITNQKTEYHVKITQNGVREWETSREITCSDIGIASIWPLRAIYYFLLGIIYLNWHYLIGPILYAPFKKSYKETWFTHFIDKKT